jgi:hypothetical protein
LLIWKVPPELIALAALRVAQSDVRAQFTSRDAELWGVAASTAPESRAAALTRLAALRDRWLRGDATARANARTALAREPVDGLPGDAVAVRGELIARAAAAEGDVAAALSAIHASGSGDAEHVAALRVLVMGILAATPGALDDATRRDALAVSLREAREGLEGSAAGAALDWWLAELTALDGAPEAQEAHLRAAAKVALAGARPAPEQILPTAWWLPLDRPAFQEFDPGRLAVSAAWVLANRLFERGAFEDALTYFEIPPPAGGCGNYVVDVESMRAVRASRCHENLGRIDAARSTLRTLVGSADASASSGVAALVDFEVRQGGAKGLHAWLDDLRFEDDRADRARAYLEFRAATSVGDTARASAAAERIRKRWPTDPVLRARIESKDAPDSGR